LARDAGCDLLFAPGGSYSGSFRPFVTMSRNMLPFEASEAARFGWSWTRLRLRLLRFAQARTFARADGMIFLTGYARDTVTRAVRCRRSTVVPHGVNPRFLREPSVPRAIDDCSATRPLQLLYVSIIDMYKHQAQVAEAVADLHATGLPLRLDLVGPAYGPALAHLRATLAQVDPRGQCVHYRGAVPYPSLPVLYHQADLFVFASSCENMPNILLEAMAAGLPIACSNRGPMPEVLGDAGTYFDPERPEEIAAAVRALAESPSLRREKAALAYERAQAYSWRRCARETFGFLEGVVSRR